MNTPKNAVLRTHGFRDLSILGYPGNYWNPLLEREPIRGMISRFAQIIRRLRI